MTAGRGPVDEDGVTGASAVAGLGNTGGQYRSNGAAPGARVTPGGQNGQYGSGKAPQGAIGNGSALTSGLGAADGGYPGYGAG